MYRYSIHNVERSGKGRFSFSRNAQKWNNLYDLPYKSVEAISFRQRRNYTVQDALANLTENSHILIVGCDSGSVLSKLVVIPLNLNFTSNDYFQDMLDLATINLPEKRVSSRQAG